LKFTEAYGFVHDAISREKQIKGWSRKKKEALIKGDIGELKRLAKNRVVDKDK
jgi:putative endonuclease